MIQSLYTAEFLKFSRSRGNDLSTPVPALGSPVSSRGIGGACVRRGGKRRSSRLAPPCVVLRATEASAPEYCPVADLKRFAIDLA